MHFGRAAIQENVSQSTLSSGIKELESFLGVTLVERTNKSVSFTTLGAQITDKARYVLMQTEDLVEQARLSSDPLATPVKLGVIPTIAPYITSKFVVELRKHFSNIKLYIREDTSANLINELINNKLDLALLALPFDAGQINTKIVYREGLQLAYRKKSHLVSEEQLDFDKLPDESLLLLDDGHCLRDHALAGCRLKDQRKLHTFGANSIQMLLQMVDSDLGVTLIPDMAIDAGAIRNTQIVTKPLPRDRFFRDIGFAWRKGTSRESLLNEIMSLLPH
ncbi:MAG: LysR family hydrogen peroxide-inducible transcriptional activator [Candidatus Azotimanducaceae bacterium]|jgi:LysR family hydrogen peroxide-inducible transcriptional activator